MVELPNDTPTIPPTSRNKFKRTIQDSLKFFLGINGIGA
jgi:hypothetical protein